MIGIQYACLFTKNGVSTSTLRPHADRTIAVEQAVSLAEAEDESGERVRKALADDAGIYRWEIVQVSGDAASVSVCAVQIAKIGGGDNDPTTVVAEAKAVVERSPAPELSVESQNTLVRNGLD